MSDTPSGAAAPPADGLAPVRPHAAPARAGLLGWLADLFDAVFARLLGWASRGTARAGLLVLAVALLSVLPGLTELPVTDRDEGRFVQATKQMVASGDLIDIRFQEDPRWKKPVGIYWLQALSTVGLGGTEAPIWAYRLPSALAVVLGALAMLWVARPLVGPRAALLSALILPTLLLATAEANIAKTDAALMLTATLALGGLARAVTGTAGPFTWLVFWLAIAGGILLKGPIVPGIVILALVTLSALSLSRPRIGSLRPVAGLALTLVLVAPWLVAIWIVSDGAFFAEAVGDDLVGKIAEGQESHGAPPGLYLALVWLTFWPWAVFLPGALGGLWRAGGRRAGRALWALLLASWAVPFWIVLEAVPTKLPHYVLPLYPALAVAVAAAITGRAGTAGEAAPDPGPRRDHGTPGTWAGRAGWAVLAIPALVLALAVLILPLLIEGVLVWPAVGLGALGAFFTLVAGAAWRRGRRHGQALASIAAALALYPAVLHHALPAMATAFPSPRIAAAVAPWQACASAPLISLGYREPSLVFLTETGIDLASHTRTAERLLDEPGVMALVETRWRPALDQALAEQAPNGAVPDLIERMRISYFNYNRGKRETAILLTRDDPRWDACAAATGASGSGTGGSGTGG